jgi:hypothetical protein
MTLLFGAILTPLKSVKITLDMVLKQHPFLVLN